MLTVEIPGQEILQLEHLLLDLNGTLALDGELIGSVREAVSALSPLLHIVLLTADTHGKADEVAMELGCDIRVIGRGREDQEKLDYVDELGSDTVVAIGNGANDALMLADAALGIAVVGSEGAAFTAMAAADIVVSGIDAALGLLLEPPRLIATLRR